MRQVLFHIPLKADWLPANFPLYLFVLAAGFVFAALVRILAGYIRNPVAKEAVRGVSFWLGGFGVLAALVIWFAAGMMLFLAFLVCTWLASRRAESEGIPGEQLQDVAVWLFIGGLIGARITFLRFEQNKSFGEMVADFYKIWDGGIVLYGSVVGGLIAYICYYA